MTQNLDLNKMGLMPMSEVELIKIDGGNILKKIGAWIEGVWNDIKEWVNGHEEEIAWAAGMLMLPGLFLLQ